MTKRHPRSAAYDALPNILFHRLFFLLSNVNFVKRPCDDIVGVTIDKHKVIENKNRKLFWDNESYSWNVLLSWEKYK